MGKIIFKIGKTRWEVRNFEEFGYFAVYKNNKKATGLYMVNEFETEGNALLAILKTYQIQ